MSFIIFPGVITPPLTPGAVPYGTGSTVLMSAQGTAGQALVSTGAGAPIWASAVPSSTNIGGGVAGDLPYQSAPSTTTFRNLVPGAVVYGDASAPNYTAVGTAGQVLQSNATGAPSWTTNISGNAANVTGTVAVANGGTGAATLTANNVILGNGVNPVAFVAPGANGNVLQSNGTTWTSAAASSGNLILITSVNGAGLTDIDLTSGFTNSYNFYVVTYNFIGAGGSVQYRYYINGVLRTTNYAYTSITGNVGSNFTDASGSGVGAVPTTASSNFPINGMLYVGQPSYNFAAPSTNNPLVQYFNWGANSYDIGFFNANFSAGQGALTGIRFILPSAATFGAVKLYAYVP